MLRLSLLTLALVLGLLPGDRAYAASATTLARFTQAAVKRLAEYPTVGDWLDRDPHLSRFERRILREQLTASAPLPAVRWEKRPEGAAITAGDFTLVVSATFPGVVYVNGRRVALDRHMSVFAALEALHHAEAGETTWLPPLRPTPLWWPVPAQAGVDQTCMPSKWEYYTKYSWRSPLTLFNSTVGYTEHLIGLSIALTWARDAVNLVRDCEAQARDLLQIVERNRLAVKDVTCSGDDDQSIEFWTPEADEDGSPKSKTFELDYLMLIAQESAPDSGDKDKSEDDKKTKSKKSAKKDKASPAAADPDESDDVGKRFYTFGTHDLKEARTLADVNGHFECQQVQPGDKGFEETRQHVEPYRQVFEYMGDHDSCSACEPQLQRELRLPRPPEYLKAEIKRRTAEALKEAKDAKKKGKNKKNDDAAGPGDPPGGGTTPAK